jgi:diacylglycerol kinase (ATP)
MISFIVNPNAGKGKAELIWKQVEKILVTSSIPYTVHFTSHRGHATQIASEEANDSQTDRIVAIGGDGTVHEVVNGMWKSEIPFGYIPAGTGNDFAISNGIPRDPELALRRILDHQPQKIDLLSYGKEVAICNFGIGFDGAVAKTVTESNWKKRLGKLAYPWGLIRTIANYEKSTIHLTIDDKPIAFSNAWLVAICNLPTYGGGMRICPTADQKDGLLDIACVHGISAWRLLTLFPLVYRGAHATNPALTFYQGKKIRVEADRPLTIHADGEIIGTTPIEITLIPKVLQIL